jgi:hypothetical protein
MLGQGSGSMQAAPRSLAYFDLTGDDGDAALDTPATNGDFSDDIALLVGRKRSRSEAASGGDEDVQPRGDQCTLAPTEPQAAAQGQPVQSSVQVAAAATATGCHKPPAEPAAEAAELLEDDLLVVAEVGQTALRDLPHPRPVCGVHAFTAGKSCAQNAARCSHCYCYVCDAPAVNCASWGDGALLLVSRMADR